MAVKETRGRGWSRLHFVIRFLGLAGLLVGAVAAFTAGAYLIDWVSSLEGWPSGEQFDQLYQRVASEPILKYLSWIVLGGLAVVLLAVLVEMLVVINIAAGRRSAFGANVALQIGLALALLIGLNLYSYFHYLRLDWTRSQQFTLAEPVPGQMRQLKDDMTIVVYQPNISFGKFSDKPDEFDKAAGRKVTEKVRDLVEQFRQLGPQFRVEVLDIDDENYGAKLAGLTKRYPDLKAAIDKAAENSIFIMTKDRLQRLSFNEFYYLDKMASKEADGGQGNLVLLSQGVGPFARRVLSLEEKRPRVGVATIHQVLSTQRDREISMPGLRKALEANGFEVKDILLKKWQGPPEPAAAGFEEQKLEQLEAQQAADKAAIKRLETVLSELDRDYKEWKEATLAELTKKYAERVQVKEVTERIRGFVLEDIDNQRLVLRARLARYLEQEGKTSQELAEVKDVESLTEQRRLTDIQAKLSRMLADCDLLIVPRLTLLDLANSETIPPRLYRLDDAQVAAIKDFLKAGKPVLACLGPGNEDPERSLGMENLGQAGPDGFDRLLADLGVKLGKQTVLYEIESQALAEGGSGMILLGTPGVEVPPALFDWKPGAGLPQARDAAPHAASRPPHPIRQSMALISRGVGKDNVLDLRIRHPRPIYFEPPPGVTLKHDPIIMQSARESWNEDNPFPTRERIPEFRPTRPTDPAKGTFDEVRNGPFPIGIAVEEPVPASWYDEKDTRAATVRLAVIGHGGLFIGKDLSPPTERLLVNTCNWLLGRDDRLPTAENAWQFPRVHLSPAALFLWQWGGWLGPPVLFAFLGLVVVMVRRLR